MKNLKIWMKMAIGLGAIILLLAVLSVLTSSLLRGVNKEALALQDEYLPIQDIATQLNANVLRVPALMNDYLLTGKKETYEHLEDVFKTIRQKFADMADLQARFPHLNAGFVAKAKTAYDALEQTVHASHDTHEKFMAQRTHMINTGAKLVQEVAAFVAAEGAMQQEALRAQDTAELNRILPLIREANLILDGVNAIRASMMRSLAEQNRSYAKDNVPVRFPALLKRVDDLNTMVFNPRIQEILKSLRASVVNFRDVQISMQQLWDEQEKLTAARVPAREATLTLMQQVVDRADEMQNTAMSHMTGAVNNSINVTLAICMITLLITMAVGFGLTRSITVPVAQALRFAQAVAGGRLDQRLGLHRRDEIGQLSEALDSMVDSLNEKINDAEKKSQEAEEQSRKAQEAMEQAEAAGQEARGKTQAMLVAADKLETVGNVVSSASTQLSAQIEQSDRGAAESAQRLSEAATAMNEMNATVQEVARNAGSASNASTETKQKAEAGAQVVAKAVRSIDQVHQMSLELKDDMTQLNGHAQDITRIMGVISDIADQTNLLALNAAIEAARAGDAGRGFAVVADEVRKLAEKTMASTQDVGNAIKAIQESTAKSMTGVDQAVERIGEATELAGQSGAALEEIVTTVEATGDQVNAIATASEEQSAASEEINQSIVQVNDMARQTAEAMAEAAKAVSDLAAQAQSLTNLIQELKEA
ncbi:HAMP domain-containing methyl-accepting chemotaxis protein [Desulfovibrio fairfieldensis]|uniref:Chemotaxis protein n=1 Tax=Desulfovibrio fairfieldensis TaxID=44742 RepID=A0A109W4I2_9BACT|nr:methyl-accepting chemotaxis protein [Desulfovibrio fairfieldensis]AMD90469.1 chemotaxis protein [Desulfovibrio fairfieldensis]